jgi:hypothetical protein
MPPKLIEDAHVQRILRNLKSGVRDGRDITDLIGDREARVALELKTTRQIHHLRKRLAQAVAYLDGLAGEAQKTASGPWEKQTPCEVCGAPATGNRSEQNPKGGHLLVTEHPDGTKCRKP